MRTVLGVVLLLALFAAAVFVQRRWTNDVRARRDAEGYRFGATGQSPDGWSHVTIGAASGVEPRAADPASPDAAVPARPVPEVQPPAPRTEPSVTRTVEHTVVKGETLTSICSAHYGSNRQDLVRAVARYNGLADVDDLRLGQVVRLPDLATLASAPR